ncbi:MAG: ATP-dependent Clp protease proteolytic subunit, partial [Corynebacterium sp.]|nr:ATP-dependent Clp protease proteolytic subunit [Corynebacterium sp.]
MGSENMTGFTHATELSGLTGTAGTAAPTGEVSGVQMPTSRYILPSFVEHSSWGAKESNPYNKLFEERIIF